jgi:glycosyltransferase involved in cell wall biosynthesis
LAQRLGLEDSVRFLGGVPIHEMAAVIANADLGVVPKRADSFGNEAYSTKIMEFMSQGVPVVVSRTKIDSFYFEEGVVHFFRSGDSQAMAQAMLDVINNPNLRESLIARGYEYVERNDWAQKKQEYVDLIDSLSTEHFDDVHPKILAGAPRKNGNTRPITVPKIGSTGTLPLQPEDAAPVSLLEKN